MPRCSMYGVFTYIWVIYGVNVGTYSIHGAYGMGGNREAKKGFHDDFTLISPQTNSVKIVDLI